MRDDTSGYLFNDLEDCCEAHFPYQKACGYNDPSGTMYYPQYSESTCYEKQSIEFDAYDTEKYPTKNACCMEKFGVDVVTCCQEGEGECVSTGTTVYIPNWSAQACQSRDSSLVTEWETYWISNTIEECCEECK